MKKLVLTVIAMQPCLFFLAQTMAPARRSVSHFAKSVTSSQTNAWWQRLKQINTPINQPVKPTHASYPSMQRATSHRFKSSLFRPVLKTSSPTHRFSSTFTQGNDPYLILDVPRTATKEDIKKAYLKKAMLLHPDHNPYNPHAAAEFRHLKEAYDNITTQRIQEEQWQQELNTIHGDLKQAMDNLKEAEEYWKKQRQQENNEYIKKEQKWNVADYFIRLSIISSAIINMLHEGWQKWKDPSGEAKKPATTKK